MRILAVHRYYWPDAPPYSSILRKIVERWHQDGHEVEVLSSQPSYNDVVAHQRRRRREIVDEVPVRRLSLPQEKKRPIIRLVNALRLCSSLLWNALIRPYDVIMISTVPPVLGGAAAALTAKLTGARFIYHCMDIHPEIGRISGEFSNPLVYGVLSRLDSWNCGQADPVVVLSGDMEKTLRKRPSGRDFTIRILNNFSLPSEKEIPSKLPFNVSSDKLTVLFAGNIGRFQGLETVVEAAAMLKNRDDVEVIFMGEGVEKVNLQKKAALMRANIHFVGHQPVEIAKAAMQQADYGFVSLIPGIHKYAYPSKTMTYLEQGCPLIVAVGQQSELAVDVRQHGYGYCVDFGDSKELAELLDWLANDRTRHAEMRRIALKRAEEMFSEKKLLKKWSELIADRS